MYICVEVYIIAYRHYVVGVIFFVSFSLHLRFFHYYTTVIIITIIIIVIKGLIILIIVIIILTIITIIRIRTLIIF